MKIEELQDNEVRMVGKLDAKSDPTPQLYLAILLKKIKNNNKVIVCTTPQMESICEAVLNMVCWNGFMKRSAPVMQECEKRIRVYVGKDGKKFTKKKIVGKDGSCSVIEEAMHKRTFVKIGDYFYLPTNEKVKMKVYVLEKPAYMQQ